MVLRDRSGIKKPCTGLNHIEAYKAFNKIKHSTSFFNVKMREYYPSNRLGNMLPGDINGLIDLINFTGLNHTHKMVEVGSFYGASTVIFALSKANIDSIEPFSCEVSDMVYNGNHITEEDFKEIANCYDENIKEYNNVNKIKADSRKVVENYADNSLDFVYIDANHTYEDIKIDINLWLPKIKKGGWLCGHDFSFEGIAVAIFELFGGFLYF